ncbi:uncharacterized protein LOC117181972 [Belonocnema kinseyi]|uniref:uncharacterized protein LOC117181972 n=1 Tax=Belonocnema kinseyi TaxID=2817044 RepID=UPI00143D6F98|nr:uncharacterized protein LOC117181972 [Belonocnema kinseyi]
MKVIFCIILLVALCVDVSPHPSPDSTKDEVSLDTEVEEYDQPSLILELIDIIQEIFEKIGQKSEDGEWQASGSQSEDGHAEISDSQSEDGQKEVSDSQSVPEPEPTKRKGRRQSLNSRRTKSSGSNSRN